MSWFQKLLPPKIKRREGEAKKNVPEGLWHKCPSCQAVLYHSDLEKNQSVCPKCHHHHRITARTRLDLLLDGEGRFEIGAEVLPVDTLKFKDSRKYSERLIASKKSTDEDDALVVMQGSIHAVPVVTAAFEFGFMGGSMGSVVGERFVGGVPASFAFMGDVVIAEPGALIGFAGARVIQQTVRETLPEGFQRAEFLLEHGAIDMIIDRREMKNQLATLITLLTKQDAVARLEAA